MQRSFKNHLLRSLQLFRKKKVLVVGDLMLDLYIEGPPRSVSQEAPVIIVRAQRKYYKLGGAANSAENIKALGGSTILAGVIGDHNKHDDFGRSFLETLKKSKMPLEGVIFDHSRPTTLKMRVLSQGQQIVRVDEETSITINKTIENNLIQYIKRVAPKVDSILVSDYNKGVITSRVMTTLMEVEKTYRVPIVVDPKPEHTELYLGVDFITPNDIELSRMFGFFETVPDTKIPQLIRKLKKNLKIRNVLVTRGAQGMDLYDEQKRMYHLPSFAEKVVDVSGAGDTVAAIIAMGINDLTPYEVSYLASIAAKLSIEKVGTATVSTKELAEFIRR